MAKFIGKDNLTHIAEKLAPSIILGPAYFAPEELNRLGIKTVTGVQFKDVRFVLNRKGGQTRRKVVGQEVNNQVGYIDERIMTCHLVWWHGTDNEDNYVEDPFPVEGTANFAYPFSEEALLAIGRNFSDDIFACLFFGDAESEDPSMALYDGFHTNINKDIENGLISEALKNLIPSDAVSKPSDAHDTSAWDIAQAWQLKWSPALKRQKVNWLLSPEDGLAIARAYANSSHGNEKVRYEANGNFTVPELPNVTFVPSAEYGNGGRWVVTLPGNLELGVNSNDSRVGISVKIGSDKDNKDIFWQIQTIMGTRVLQVAPHAFVMNDGSIQSDIWRGDYEKTSYSAVSNDTTLGTVSVSPDPTNGEYAAGTTLTLTATPKADAEFVKWSNGATTASITVVTKGRPEGIVAIFKSTASSSSSSSD